MNTNNITFSDYDGQSVEELSQIKFLDLNKIDFEGTGFLDSQEQAITNKTPISRRSPLSYSPLSKNGTSVKDNFFGGSKSYKYNNFEIIIDPSSGVNPPDKIKVIESSFYWDTNHSGEFGDTINGVADKFAFTVKLFISNFENQITDAYNDPTIIPNPKEILLFLEDNTNDWSGATVYIKKGSDLKNLKFIDATMANNPRFINYIQKNNNISLSDLKELLRTDKVENQGLNLISCLFEIASFGITDSSLLKAVSKGIKFLNEKIKETCSFEDKSWNPAKVEANTAFEPILFPSSNEFLDELDDDKINKTVTEMIANFGKHFKEYDVKILELLNSNMGVVPVPILLPPFMFVKTVDVIPKDFEELLLQKYKRLRVIVYDLLDQLPTFDFSDILKGGINIVNAFLCGIWNGFIEAICGIISLVQYLFEGAEFMADLLENFKEKGPQVLEKIDDIILNFQNIDFGKIFSKLAHNFFDFIKNGANVSLVEVAYFCGAFVGFVVELAVEIVIGILFTGGVLTIEAVFAKIGETFKAIAGLLTGAIRGLYKAGEKTLSSLLKGFDFLVEFLSKGTDEILRIIDEVFAKLKQVGEEILENINKLKEKAKSILSKETKYDALYRDITKKFFINNKGVLSDREFFKIGSKIAEAFKVEMILIDRNSEKFAELFAKWEKSPIYAVFHDSTFVNGRYGIVLEGPAIYFFKGKINRNFVREAIEITSYTVQHELLHVKLWHKMVIEFPELAQLYRKIPRVLDEMNVIGEMLKQNSRKIAKWDIKDILNDLNIINDNIKRYPSWKEHSRKIFGKEEFGLKDFENWDLGKYLKDL